ncbi:POLA1 [Cordylochernes scorpioides]|uniref:DNA polymerase n=1 Tax=Cordylochernes scorpioides TaxID=51811 RepID=A0ABY6KX68_9ARAC|nr:POLA1 [Cordylochernes scorpioides]
MDQGELPALSQTSLQSQDLFESQCLEEMQLDFSEEFTEELAEISPEKPKHIPEPAEPEWKEAEWSGPNQAPLAPEITFDSSNLPLETNSKGESVFRFFWLDAYEDHLKHPGVIYLFGKVWLKEAKSHVSCCVIVRNVERKVYLLPRIKRYNLKAKAEMDQEVTMKDVYLEFNDQIASKFNISEFRSKPCKMSYVFGKPGVPKHSDYLLVRYSATYPTLPADLEGETFSHVFGSATTGLELLLLESRMRGPCWLDVAYPQPSNPPVSWCKVEVTSQRLDSISVASDCNLPLPPLVVMALNFQACPTSNPLQQEIVSASCLIHTEFPLNKAPPNPPYQNHFCALSKPSNSIFPFDFSSRLADYKGTLIKQTSSERNLLNLLAAQVAKHDPDLIVGHDIVGSDLELLLQRIVHHKVPQWSKLGRLRRAAMLKPGNRDGRLLTCGRLVCDVKISAQELIRARSYDLNELTIQLLNQHQLPVIDPHQIPSLYTSSSSILGLVNTGMTQAEAALRIAVELNALPLALQITSLAGNLLSRTFLGGRSERNEYLLMHAFHEKNYICPDKLFGRNKQAASLEEGQDDGAVVSGKKSARRKPAYTGGLVLEPKKGFYDRFILLMDFNSLYPSIIQEYNICFTTLDLAAAQKSEDNEILPDRDAETGILPAEIRKLVESRRQVKKLMKSPDLSAELRMQYDIRQKALKLTANSMYGCLGFSNSRFYAKPLASLITSKGREILFKTKELVERLGLEVIYGDTDSIMINTNSVNLDEVMKLGQNVKNEVNGSYRELEIDIDGIYKSMLLLKKKKYAALAITRKPDGQIVTNQETKGLDIVRRDWSELAKKCGEFVLKELLSGQPKEDFIQSIHAHLADLKEKVLSDQLPIEDFLILKQLTKAPEEYPDKKNLPHVQVALRLNSKGGRRLRQGDIIKYVVCDDGSNLPATQRAYHPDEMKANGSLKLDTKYYLSQQVHPVVSRLCDPIDGTDAATIAEFLGLDPSGYRHRTTNHDDAEDSSLLGAAKNDETRFADCEKPQFKCPQCPNIITAENPLHLKDDNTLELPLDKCLQCNNALTASSNQIANQVFHAIRQHVDRYYKSWLTCEDPGCSYRTRRLPLNFTLQGPTCPQCAKAVLHREYSEDQLYQQLSFYKHLFDISSTLAKMDTIKANIADSQLNPSLRSLYSTICKQADHWLARSAYRLVHLGNLFSIVHH